MLCTPLRANGPQGVVDPGPQETPGERPCPFTASGLQHPATPSQYAEDAIAEGLSGALHLVAPDQGHGMASVGCVPDLMQEFIEAASTEGLDADCLDRVMATPFFLSAAGPGP